MTEHATNITLSADQSAAVSDIEEWYRNTDDPEFVLGGLAGTGKTTLVRYLRDEMGLPIDGVIAPTGKAAFVLRKKGLPATTIHSAIYRCVGEVEDEKTGRLKPVFEDRLPDLHPGSLVVVDESSMVNEMLANDIRKQGWRILWVGDHGQLPPIGRDPGLMKRPDVRLEQIHRQGRGNPIIELAHHVRDGDLFRDFNDDAFDNVAIVPQAKFTMDTIAEFAIEEKFDQVIVGYNKTRRVLNECFREQLGYDDADTVVVPGDRVICLRNDRKRGIFNGMVFVVRELLAGYNTGRTRALIESVDMPGFIVTADMEDECFGDDMPEWEPGIGDFFDYGYAITCHKSQGSEWDSVLVVDQPFGSDEQITRWRYTAVTRAAKNLVVMTK